MVKKPPGNAEDVGLIRSPGGGNDNPLQYSSLESPMDRGAWRATVHKATKSRTRLSRHHTRTGWLYKPCPSSRVTLPLGTAYTSEASLAEKKGVVLGVMLVQPLLHCLWTPKESSTAVDLTVNTCRGDGDRFYTEEEN